MKIKFDLNYYFKDHRKLILIDIDNAIYKTVGDVITYVVNLFSIQSNEWDTILLIDDCYIHPMINSTILLNNPNPIRLKPIKCIADSTNITDILNNSQDNQSDLNKCSASKKKKKKKKKENHDLDLSYSIDDATEVCNDVDYQSNNKRESIPDEFVQLDEQVEPVYEKKDTSHKLSEITANPNIKSTISKNKDEIIQISNEVNNENSVDINDSSILLDKILEPEHKKKRKRKHKKKEKRLKKESQAQNTLSWRKENGYSNFKKRKVYENGGDSCSNNHTVFSSSDSEEEKSYYESPSKESLWDVEDKNKVKTILPQKQSSILPISSTPTIKLDINDKNQVTKEIETIHPQNIIYNIEDYSGEGASTEFSDMLTYMEGNEVVVFNQYKLRRLQQPVLRDISPPKTIIKKEQLFPPQVDIDRTPITVPDELSFLHSMESLANPIVYQPDIGKVRPNKSCVDIKIEKQLHQNTSSLASETKEYESIYKAAIVTEVIKDDIITNNILKDKATCTNEISKSKLNAINGNHNYNSGNFDSLDNCPSLEYSVKTNMHTQNSTIIQNNFSSKITSPLQEVNQNTNFVVVHSGAKIMIDSESFSNHNNESYISPKEAKTTKSTSNGAQYMDHEVNFKIAEHTIPLNSISKEDKCKKNDKSHTEDMIPIENDRPIKPELDNSSIMPSKFDPNDLQNPMIKSQPKKKIKSKQKLNPYESLGNILSHLKRSSNIANKPKEESNVNGGGKSSISSKSKQPKQKYAVSSLNQTPKEDGLTTNGYETYAIMKNMPTVGDEIVFQEFEVDEKFCPVYSDYKQAKVTNIAGRQLTISMTDEFNIVEEKSIDWREIINPRLINKG